MKIVYCLNSICVLGGIGAVTCAKANALASIPDNEVYIVVTDHDESKCPPLSGVKLIDLDVNHWQNDSHSIFYAFSRIARNRMREHEKKLNSLLEELQPDVVISVGWSEKYIIPKISKGKPWVTIREYHYDRNYRFQYLRFQNNYKFSAYVRALLGTLYEKWKGRNLYDHTVILTQQDKEENWKGENNISVIPNPSSFYTDKHTNYNNKVAVTACRLHPVKQVDHLIEAWETVAKQHTDWQLHIYGDGPDEKRLTELISSKGLSNIVILKGRSYDMASSLSSGDFFIYASAYEGFGMVLVEAMTCGLPCISYLCPCGPKDIISDKIDGIHVPLNNIQDLANSILCMIENPDILQQMGHNALKKAEQYDVYRLAERWMTLFNDLHKDKQYD